jgi:hypothetical protein
MSDKQFEPCTLGDATHVEVNGKVYLLGGKEVELEDYHGERIGIRWQEGDVFIPVDAFPIFGVQPMREEKPEPIEFEAIVKQDMPFAYLSNVPDGIPLGTKFRCVEILEDE